METVEIKRSELLGLDRVLEELANAQGNVNFAYAIAKTKINIASEVQAVKETVSPSEEFMNYERERTELCNQLGDKDSEGRPLMVTGGYLITKNRKEFDEQYAALREKYKEAIEQQEGREEETRKFLEEEVEVNIHKIDLNDLPTVVTPAFIQLLMIMIKDGDQVVPASEAKENVH